MASRDDAVQHRFDEQPIVRRGHPDRAFAPGQQVFDPLPLVVTQSGECIGQPPNKLTAYELKKPTRRIFTHDLMPIDG